MATMALIQPFRAMIHRPPEFKGGLEQPEFWEADNQTFGIDDFIYVDTNGRVAICTVDGSNRLNGVIAGQAKKKAIGGTAAQATHNVHFPIIKQDESFLMSGYHSTAASSALAQNMLGTVRGIIKVSGKWHVDLENAVEGASDALARVKIIGFPAKHPDGTRAGAIGDIYPILEVKFLDFSAASDQSPMQNRILQFA